MSAPQKRNWIPTLVVSGGLLLYMAPAAFAFAADYVQRDDACRARHPALTVDDSEDLAALSVALMNDHQGGDCLLASYTMTREGYVDVMASVTRDPRRSAAYNEAFVRLQR